MDILLEKRDGKIIRPDEIKLVMDSLSDGRYMLSLRKWAKRTLEQNRYYWNLLNIVWSDTGDDPNYLHTVFKQLFLRKIFIDERFGEIIEITSTTKLTTKAFKEYIDNIVNRCVEQWYTIPLEW